MKFLVETKQEKYNYVFIIFTANLMKNKNYFDNCEINVLSGMLSRVKQI
jgi:hypothetical protein